MTSRSAIFLNSVRHYTLPIKSWVPSGVKYGKVTYYPKNKDHVDPPFTPSKVLLVKRVKPFAYNPHWEKTALRNLGFEEKKNDPVIVKNTPEICTILWKVKHLVKITPIKLPDKLPTTDDLNGTYLHENGTFYITPKIDSTRYKVTEEFINNPKRLRRHIITEKLRLQWLSGRFM